LFVKKRKKLRFSLEKTFYSSKLWEEMDFPSPFELKNTFFNPKTNKG